MGQLAFANGHFGPWFFIQYSQCLLAPQQKIANNNDDLNADTKYFLKPDKEEIIIMQQKITGIQLLFNSVNYNACI